MARSISLSELNKAVELFNNVLKENNEELIRTKDVPKEEVIEQFINKVLDFVDKDMAYKLPKEVIRVNNKYVAEKHKMARNY